MASVQSVRPNKIPIKLILLLQISYEMKHKGWNISRMKFYPLNFSSCTPETREWKRTLSKFLFTKRTCQHNRIRQNIFKNRARYSGVQKLKSPTRERVIYNDSQTLRRRAALSIIERKIDSSCWISVKAALDGTVQLPKGLPGTWYALSIIKNWCGSSRLLC